MDEDWEFEETLRRLAGPVDRRGVWADIEARAGVAPWGLGVMSAVSCGLSQMSNCRSGLASTCLKSAQISATERPAPRASDGLRPSLECVPRAESGPFGVQDHRRATWDMILGGQGSLALAPSSPSTLYAWTSAGLFRSDDGGGNWTELAGTGLAPRPEGWGPMFGGLLLVAADDPDTLFAASGPEFRQLFRSTDGGNSWSEVLDYIGSLVADPADPSALYAITHPGLPSLSFDRVSKSTDQGRTWATVSPKEWGVDIAELVIDPSSPSNVYVFLQTESGSYTVSRSVDGGVNWENVGLEGAGKYLGRIRFDPHSPGTLYALTFQAAESDPDRGLYRSEDGGRTWVNIAGELADDAFSDIVVDSAPGGALYAVTESGLFKWAAEGEQR